MALKIDPKSCPMCGAPLQRPRVRNATSRFYAGLYICSPCGVNEAFDGKPARTFDAREVAELKQQQVGA